MRPLPAPDVLAMRDVRVTFGGMAVLQIDAFQAEPGSLWGCAGPSGCGKTTFLHVLAGLLKPDSGAVLWGETDIAALPEGARDRWRRETVGMVFQDFQLIPELSAVRNVLLPATFNSWTVDRSLRARALTLLREMGIARPDTLAGALSPGEQQRVALARAMLARPRLILADEPTASLDRATAATVTDLLQDTVRRSGATLIAVSHDEALLDRMQHRLVLNAGRIAS